jgi:putative SOS response-associated peptidase YedK
MCGRYTISIDEQEIRDIVNTITQQRPGMEVKTGEIYPTNPAPVLLAGRDKADVR